MKPTSPPGTSGRPAHPKYLGRYELREVLGKGVHATVWLAHDPRLDRQVAIKVMQAVRPGAGAAMEPWLREARHVARLSHPHIATLFEADVIDGQPSLVFEYVAGQTLAAHLLDKGAMPATDAVALMLSVLDALQSAHAAGVVHRDLKPSNILLDRNLRPKVTDFGIAARMGTAEVDAATVQGTPGYLSPEAATGQAATDTSDVFSAALVLAEMLFGQALVDGRDTYRAIYRVTHEDLALPQDGVHDVDDALRTLLMRALARDARRRIASAEALAQALREWQGQQQDSSTPEPQASHATLGFLLRRMRHKSDFPAMSESIGRVQSMASSENESLNSLTSEILKDVALTNKLLRLVNTPQFAHAGGGSISTVSRAVSLIGFVGIRNMAMSLVLLEHMQNKAHANLLKVEFLRALLAGSLASDLCALSREGEEVFIGSLFQNLGRLLTEFYFPEEAQEMRKGVASGKSEDVAALGVLGMTCEDLGLGVARVWDLPASIQRLMRKPAGNPPTRAPADTEERLRWLCLAANDMADAFLHKEGDALARELARLSSRYAGGLGLEGKHIQTVALAAREKLAQTAEAMGVHVSSDSPAARLLRPAQIKELPVDSLQPLELTAEPAPDEPETAQPSPPPRAVSADLLATGIQDITNAMVEDFELNDVLRMVLETMYRALGFRRVLFCLRDAATQSLTGRFGLGEDAASVAKLFRVPLKDAQDLFGMVCNKGLDTLIRDAGVPNVAQKLPVWYRSQINAPAFLLLPLQLKGTPFGLIYADKASASDIALDEKELALLKTLRNQAVMAFRQSRP
ncbi:tyrosine kinase family protein [Hydrogenophaga sp. RAC07]|uniref:serine/threonine protein kinase n=1 Tax=Hydrogenophaga sp. RAC07 TaxID=1842537 RepID=UPI00083CC919|nr:serine/threonine protein kinase [Hydrogenophaga sp. RAC07]AOF84138.1 tyrosine kinase family protein [Hydrogenophaga sp. RAC07]